MPHKTDAQINEACKHLHHAATTEIDVCDDLIAAIGDAVLSPEDRVILWRKAKVIRANVARLTNEIDFDEPELT